MRKTLLLVSLLCMMVLTVFAQERKISGVVKAPTGETIPGVAVIVKGTTLGAVTDIDGKFSLLSSSDNPVLVFKLIGYKTLEQNVGTQSNISITLEEDVEQLDEVVVTALGVSREERSLGYAVQKVEGDDIVGTSSENFTNSLSGRVSGVQVRSSGNMGGSSNIVIRGYSTIGSNNQPLYVVDGVPLSNANMNDASQNQGYGGYDYGDLSQDIDPASIETISVLKGASATALYGSRGQNGVILITTKKGTKRKGIGVTVGTNVAFDRINTATMPKFQREYGPGYGGEAAGFYEVDENGNTAINFGDDASFGPRFDPNLMVRHWDSFDPTNPATFGETRPYTASNNGPEEFYETGVSQTYTVALEGGNETSKFRLGYTYKDISGILPNSSMKRNNINFSASHDFSDRLTASFSGSYVGVEALGRNGTGYDPRNVGQMFNQWFQTGLDFHRLKENYKDASGNQITWNRIGVNDPDPFFFDNPYWVRYENFQNDARERVYGNVNLSYKLAEGWTISGIGAIDTYNLSQEERVAKGSIETSMYGITRRAGTETNFDLRTNYNKRFGENFSVNALLGGNIRSENTSYLYNSTRGGLVVDRLYALSNSVSPEYVVSESVTERQMQSIYASASLGWKDMVFVDLAGRNDWSSTLPIAHNSFFYPSISSSFIFTELESLNQSDFISFGKVRLGYAQVGNDTSPYRTRNYFNHYKNFGEVPQYSLSGSPTGSVLFNPELKPERTNELEFGLEMMFLQRRFGFDLTLYNRTTTDQILAVQTTAATGYTSQFKNAGDVSNKGIELTLNATPVRLANGFEWNIGVNFTKNTSEVTALADGVNNLLLGRFAGSATLNAAVGQPLGVIKGTNYTFHENGGKVVGSNGMYVIAADENGSVKTDEVIGHMQPDWTGGITTSVSYKGFSVSALIDGSFGGDIMSESYMYGLATGLYEETAGLNANGVPRRDPVSAGGGHLWNGVKEDGSANDIYADNSGFGGAFYYGATPDAQYIYDATYVKLRDVSISYNLPKSLLSNLPFTRVNVGVYGRNLAILYKNMPYFDPEITLSSGNIQGFESGATPTTRTFGFNVNLTM